jgi:hypothetical protein
MAAKKNAHGDRSELKSFSKCHGNEVILLFQNWYNKCHGKRFNLRHRSCRATKGFASTGGGPHTERCPPSGAGGCSMDTFCIECSKRRTQFVARSWSPNVTKDRVAIHSTTARDGTLQSSFTRPTSSPAPISSDSHQNVCPPEPIATHRAFPRRHSRWLAGRNVH